MSGSGTFRFCPRCGSGLALRSVDGEERPRLVCTRCGFVLYQNSKPCAGALVVQEGRVLLARRAGEPFKGQWDIPGGFLENGEHPEAGVVRELREETGLEVRPTDLLGIYIDTYRSDDEYTLNVYYLAEVVGGRLQPASDVSSLSWFGPDELPEEMAFAHEYELLEDWKKRGNDKAMT